MRGQTYADGGAGFDGWALTQKCSDAEPEMRVLRAPLSYRSRAGAVFTVPRGFVYDGASIPRVVWSLLPSRDACLEFATLHDWLYRVGPSIGIDNRRVADDVGWESLVIQGIGDEWQRDAIWEGLRLGGGEVWVAWRNIGFDAADPVALITPRPW